MWRPHGAHQWLMPPAIQEDEQLLTRVTAAAMAFTAIGDTGVPCYICHAVTNITSRFSPCCFYTRETLLRAQETAIGNLGQSLPLVAEALKP